MAKRTLLDRLALSADEKHRLSEYPNTLSGSDSLAILAKVGHQIDGLTDVEIEMEFERLRSEADRISKWPAEMTPWEETIVWQHWYRDESIHKSVASHRSRASYATWMTLLGDDTLFVKDLDRSEDKDERG